MPERKFDLAKFLFFTALVCIALGVAFAAGLYSGTKRNAVFRLARNLENTLTATFMPHHLFPAVYEFTGARTHDNEAMAPGVTLVTSYFSDMDWRPGIKLIDADGAVLHSWNADPGRLSPGMEDIQRYVHGTYLFPDGDLLVNLEYGGLFRLNACGDIVWQIQSPATHHSIFSAADGTFWASANVERNAEQDGEEYLWHHPGFSYPIYEDHLLNFTAEGEVLRDIDLMDVIFANGLQRLIPKIGDHLTGDIFHLNDVEQLSPELAPEYPLFREGDLLLSLRTLHTVLVLDPDSLEVKWSNHQAFIEQHDPDFIGEGWIGVFDNNRDETFRGALLGGTRITAIKPETGEIKQLYPTALSDPFYTEAGGKWQMLPNGNLLMVEARAGRAFEAAPDGRTVWEWVNDRYDEDRVPSVLEATRYDMSPETIAGWRCE